MKNVNYECSLTPELFRQLTEDITQKITLDVAQIDLRLSDHQPNPDDDLCTVYTSVAGGYKTRLVMCAQRKFLHRLTENMMGEPSSDPDDLEEYTKEFFNVLCGRLVGEIFRTTHLGASFHPPLFSEGNYDTLFKQGDQPEEVIYFTSRESEDMAMAHDITNTAYT